MYDFKQLQQFAQSIGYKGDLQKLPDYLASRPDIQSQIAAKQTSQAKSKQTVQKPAAMAQPGMGAPEALRRQQGVGRKGIRSFADGGYVVGDPNSNGIAPVMTPDGSRQFDNENSPTGSRWVSSNDMNYVKPPTGEDTTAGGSGEDTPAGGVGDGDGATGSGVTPRTAQEVVEAVTNTSTGVTEDLLDGNIPDEATVDPTMIESTDEHTLDKGDYTVDPKAGAAQANLPTMPGDMSGTTIETSTSQPGVEAAINKYGSAAQGRVTKTVNEGRTVDAPTMDPNDLAQLGLDAPQIGDDVGKIDANAHKRTLQSGEMVSGSAVDQARVDQLVAGITAVTGDPPEMATVRGQLAKLMLDFELNDGTPPWAAGAMRSALSMMAERGLSASSMAGQAITQAAMESATQIAYADAQTHSIFERENLSRRQQTIFMAAQTRAQFMQQEFDQEFQAKVINAAKITDIANINHNTGVQIALENSRAAQTVAVANLNTRAAKVLSDAAAMTSIQRDNLSNMMTAEMTTEQLRQQAQMANAQNFLQMDLANLSARQQMKTIGLQSVVQSVLSDTAIKNATDQFNATSEDTMKRFITNLQSNVDIVTSQLTTDVNKFNAALFDGRERFNQTNGILIDSANAVWAQSVTTGNTAIANGTAQFNAEAFSGLYGMAYAGSLQTLRDTMSYVWQSFESDLGRDFTGGENEKNRAHQIATLLLSQEFQKAMYEKGIKFESGKAVGGAGLDILGEVFDFLGDADIDWDDWLPF